MITSLLRAQEFKRVIPQLRTFDEIKVLRPPAHLVESFSQMVEPVYSLIKANELESITLTQIRDALIPKLLSGEMRISINEDFSKETDRLDDIMEEKKRLQKPLSEWCDNVR